MSYDDSLVNFLTNSVFHTQSPKIKRVMAFALLFRLGTQYAILDMTMRVRENIRKNGISGAGFSILFLRNLEYDIGVSARIISLASYSEISN